MLARALILLLIVLNLGVACWWAFAPPQMPAAVTSASTAPRLQLVSELPAGARLVPAAATRPATPMRTMPAAAVASVLGDAHCWRVGPFADVAALSRAQSWLQPRVTRATVVAVPATGRGWRVWLPPLADRDTAQAMAQQIVAAGFNDFYVVPGGDNANSIALGRYGNEDAARRRQAALQAAGFDAKAEPIGASTQWLDIAAAPALDVAAMRVAIAAPQVHPLDCAGLH